MEQVEILTVEMDDPVFYTGSTHVAHVRLRNPTAVELSYSVALSLISVGPPEASASAQIDVPASSEGTVDVVMPIATYAMEGDYRVELSIADATTGIWIASFTATELVTITVQRAVEVISITWD